MVSVPGSPAAAANAPSGAVRAAAPKPLVRQLTWWALAFPLIMVVALVRHDVRLLNWIHVLSGVLWTGADLFLGFIVGPVMRRLEVPARTAVIGQLVPRTLLYFPAVSLTTGTAGWYLANWLGMLAPGGPEHAWVLVALVLISLMTILGLGFMLPNSLRIWLELQKSQPNRDLMIRLNRFNLVNASVQGVMQIAIIVVMSRLTLG